MGTYGSSRLCGYASLHGTEWGDDPAFDALWDYARQLEETLKILFEGKKTPKSRDAILTAEYSASCVGIVERMRSKTRRLFRPCLTREDEIREWHDIMRKRERDMAKKKSSQKAHKSTQRKGKRNG